MNHPRRRSLIRASASLAAGVLLFACSGADSGPIRIGLAGPFSDSIGAPMRRAALLAVEQINERGGIRGRRVELLAQDDYGDPDSAVAVAGMLEAAGVVAVIGHVFSGASLAAAPVYNGAADPVLQISPSSSAPEITQAGDFTFRTCPSDLQQGAALAQFAANRLGLRRGTILYINDEYGRGIRATFAREFARQGGFIEEQDPYLGDTPEVRPYLERLASRRSSQFIFVGGNRPEAEEIIRAARALGLRLPILGGDALEGIEQSGALAEGSYISIAYLPSLDTPRNRTFMQDYQRRYPRALILPNQPAAASYDIVFLLAEVIGRVGTDRRAIRDAVAEIGRSRPAFDGVTGAIAFDEAGDVPRQRVIIGQVSGGTVVAVEGM